MFIFRLTERNWIFYVIFALKTIYLFMCAYHICNGYPSISNVDFLDRSIYVAVFRLVTLKMYAIILNLIFIFLLNHISSYLFIPFLFEICTAIDYCFVSTSLSFGDFMRLANNHNEVSYRNCWIRIYKQLDKV
jgi:hypothetical protein